MLCCVLGETKVVSMLAKDSGGNYKKSVIGNIGDLFTDILNTNSFIHFGFNEYRSIDIYLRSPF